MSSQEKLGVITRWTMEHWRPKHAVFSSPRAPSPPSRDSIQSTLLRDWPTLRLLGMILLRTRTRLHQYIHLKFLCLLQATLFPVCHCEIRHATERVGMILPENQLSLR